MRGKRSKQYRKLMERYGLNFGFREPYQVLVDADIMKDADKFRMDLVSGLERTLHGKVKPMITQCCMRHLYACSSDPGVSCVIDRAKLFERRRCNHRPDEYLEPLSAVECISSVVDPKGSKTNRHRYVVASQDVDVRKVMREITGIPLVYINRSVMIMEPMADATTENREREERGKFRAGLKSGRASTTHGVKRKREDEENEEFQSGSQGSEGRDTDAGARRKKTHRKGPKGPNPLAVKKPKRAINGEGVKASPKAVSNVSSGSSARDPLINVALETGFKRRRRRKHKSGIGGDITTIE